MPATPCGFAAGTIRPRSRIWRRRRSRISSLIWIRSMLEIGLVVFDWAGTTIDYGCLAPAGAFVAAFAERGVTVTLSEARGPMGLHKKDHIRTMLQMEAVGWKWRAAVGRDWSEADVEALYKV